MLWAAAGGCGNRAATAPGAPHAPPATASHRGQEQDLDTVTLTPQAEARLGVTTAAVERRAVRRTRSVAGDVLAPPGQALVIAAPLAGTISGTLPAAGTAVRRGQALVRLVPLAPPDRDVRAQSERGIEVARARAELADQRVARTEQLLRDRAGSVRQLEEARGEQAAARAELTVAQARARRIQQAPLASDSALTVRAPYDGVVRQVHVGPGQAVAGGAPIVEVTALRALWVRVPLYAGDLAAVDRAAPARVAHLGAAPDAPTREVTPVEGPLSADAAAATVDLYYDLHDGDDAFRPGERVAVALRYRGDEAGLVVPASAVVYDVNGGAWLYEARDAHAFARRRVEVARTEGTVVVLERGPVAGTRVVAVGAAELFGTEFGAGH